MVLGLASLQVVQAEELILPVDETRELSVRVMPANGDLLVIWLEQLPEPRPGFERLLTGLQGLGIEVWTCNLLSSYFQEHTTRNVMALDGAGVAALLDHAVTDSGKSVAIVASDRLALAAIRGVRLWQRRGLSDQAFAGMVLHWPNLFDTAPLAGTEPVVLPEAYAVNVPVEVFQPEAGVHTDRIGRIMQALWDGGAPAYQRMVPRVRDWWFLHDPDDPHDHDPHDASAIAAHPAQLEATLRRLDALGVPADAPALPVDPDAPARPIRGLVDVNGTQAADSFTLRDGRGREVSLAAYRGKVVVLNFWATWCPPCVEEIPSMNELSRRFGEEDVALVSVNFKEDAERIASFMDEVAVDFPVLLDPDGAVAARWKVFGFPSSFVLDRQGRVRMAVNSAIDWMAPEVLERIDTLVAEPEG
ncbi:MAG: TlpA family protein disulfide reductase [Gammaproteobacteria bacterium]